MTIPCEPNMLVSFLNTQLRDFYPTLEELCKALNLSETELLHKLAVNNYHYNPDSNQFV